MKKETMPWQHYYNMLTETIKDKMSDGKDVETIFKEIKSCSAYRVLMHQYKNFESLRGDVYKLYAKL